MPRKSRARPARKRVFRSVRHDEDRLESELRELVDGLIAAVRGVIRTGEEKAVMTRGNPFTSLRKGVALQVAKRPEIEEIKSLALELPCALEGGLVVSGNRFVGPLSYVSDGAL